MTYFLAVLNVLYLLVRKAHNLYHEVETMPMLKQQSVKNRIF